MARNKYPEITVERILNAAQRLFLEKGTALTSEVLQCVTEQAGHRRIPVGERRSYLN